MTAKRLGSCEVSFRAITQRLLTHARQAALIRTQGERNAAEAEATHAERPQHRGPPPRSVERPSNMSKITVRIVREHLGLARGKYDQEWSDIRVRGLLFFCSTSLR